MNTRHVARSFYPIHEHLETRRLLAAELVLDVNAGSSGSSPSNLIALNGRLFFFAKEPTHGRELWTSDGTASGTTVLKDIRPGAKDGVEGEVAKVGSTLFFSAIDGVHGRELWRTDGTEEGTTLVKDIHPSGSAVPSHLTVVGDTLFFTADDGIHGRELWRSNGTAAGTILVKDVTPGSESSFMDHYEDKQGLPLLAAGAILFFSPDSGCDELWRSDGTTSGTKKLGSFPGSFYDGGIDGMTAAEATLFFHWDMGTSLWKSDGTVAGTVKVTDLPSESDAAWHGWRAARAGGLVFFQHVSDTLETDLWRSDGTSAGTFKVASGGVEEITAINGKLYFTSASGRVWTSDGSQAGTVALGKALTIVPSTVSNRGYAVGSDATHGFELWRSDLSDAGTRLIQDIRSGTESSMTRIEYGGWTVEFEDVGGTTFFCANDGLHGIELWKVAPDFVDLVAGTLRVDGTSAADSIGLTVRSSTLRVRRNGELRTVQAAGVSRIEIQCADGSDIVDFSGISIPTYVDAGPGNDLVTAGSGSDSITGGAGKDTLYGGEGDDRVSGNGTNDRLFGEGGNDRLYGGDHNDLLDGGGGVDRIWGEAGNDTLNGGSSNDKLDGGSGDDSILGGKGNDILTCGGGADSLFGTDGSDTLQARDGAADILDGGADNDSASGDLAKDSLLNIEVQLD